MNEMTKCVHIGWGILDWMKKYTYIYVEKSKIEKWRVYGNRHLWVKNKWNVGERNCWESTTDMLWARVDRVWQIQFKAKHECANVHIVKQQTATFQTYGPGSVHLYATHDILTCNVHTLSFHSFPFLFSLHKIVRTQGRCSTMIFFINSLN